MIESSLQKKPRWKGLCCAVSIANGSPASREAMGEKTRKRYRLQDHVIGPRAPIHDATLHACAKPCERITPNVASSEGGGGGVLRQLSGALKVQILMVKVLNVDTGVDVKRERAPQ